jgi:hypothetical protein
MSFDVWIKTMPKCDIRQYATARVAWNACKEEASKIIKNQLIFGMNHTTEHKEMLDKIEDL